MKKIVINTGEDSSWRLSPKAIKRLAELRGQKPIFLHIYGNLKSENIIPEEIQESWWWDAFDTFNMISIDEDDVEYKIIDDSGLGPERICFNA